MTTTQRQGYDDQTAGMLNEALANADTPAGREYRDGARAARRDMQAVEQDGALPAPMPTAAEIPPEEAPAPPEPTAPDPARMGAAFSEPEPAAPKPKRGKKADVSQGDLFA